MNIEDPGEQIRKEGNRRKEVQIRRRDGALFSLRAKKKKQSSPFDVPGIKTKATTKDILDAVRDSRTG